MSWKKLMRSAKRLDMPVIVAGQDGDDPFVLMPLDHYEMLVSSEFDDGFEGIEELEDEDFDPMEFMPTEAELREIEPDESAMGAFEIVDEPQVDEQNLAKESQKINLEELQSFADMKDGASDKEGALEDRFYFEPVDDQAGK